MPRGRPKAAMSGPDKPKGRMTAYAFFVQTCRQEHKKLHPNESVQFAEFSRQCSERWKTMSDSEKKKFQDLAEVDKKRYDSEMSTYVPPAGVGRRGRRARGSRKLKDPNKPKRALSAFFYYANDERSKVRAANPDFSVGEVAKELGRQWGELTEDEKAKHEESAAKDRARYDVEMRIYKSEGAASPQKKMKASNGHPVEVKEDIVSDEEDEEDDKSDNDDDDDEEEEDSE